MSKTLCPFCNAELNQEVYNSMYGCDTGCEFVRIEVTCPTCMKVTWDSGTFGYIEDAEDEADYRDQFNKELLAALKQLAPERLRELDK